MDIPIGVLLTPLISALVPLILSIIVAVCSKKQTIEYVLIYPRFISVIIGLGFLCVGFAFYLISVQGFGENIPAEIFGCIVLVIWTFGNVFVFLYLLLYKVVLSDESLYCRNMLGIFGRYDYSEITKIVACYAKTATKPEEYTIYVGKRRITVSYLMINFNEFERIMKKRLKAAGNPIKIEEKRRKH